MDYAFITKLLIFLIVVVVVVWDLFLAISGNHSATFSVIIYESARKWPIIAFAFGMLCAHLFWQVYAR